MRAEGTAAPFSSTTTTCRSASGRAFYRLLCADGRRRPLAAKREGQQPVSADIAHGSKAHATNAEGHFRSGILPP